MTDIYCVKCKKKTATLDEHKVKTKNGRTALTGKCKICGTKKYQFISSKKNKV